MRNPFKKRKKVFRSQGSRHYMRTLAFILGTNLPLMTKKTEKRETDSGETVRDTVIPRSDQRMSWINDAILQIRKDSLHAERFWGSVGKNSRRAFNENRAAVHEAVAEQRKTYEQKLVDSGRVQKFRFPFGLSGFECIASNPTNAQRKYENFLANNPI